MKDYYEILGVIPTAEDMVIKSAYKAKAQLYHPDKFSGSPSDANSKMSEINEAGDVLCNPEKRRAYDSQLVENVSKGTDEYDKEHDDADFENIDQGKPNEPNIQDILNSSEWKGYENCWISTRSGLIFVDSSCKASISTSDELTNALNEKGSHKYFDRSEALAKHLV